MGVALEYFGNEKKLTSILVLHTGKFYASELVNKNPKTGAPRAQATIKQIKRVFRQCLEFALEQNFIDILPVPKSEMEHARSRKKSTITETPQPETTVQRSFEQWLTATGIDKSLTIHSLRHTFASTLYEKSNNLLVVKQALGHRSVTSTMIYTHLNPEQLIDSLESI